eukprot:188201-Amphidinium_carterae.1
MSREPRIEEPIQQRHLRVNPWSFCGHCLLRKLHAWSFWFVLSTIAEQNFGGDMSTRLLAYTTRKLQDDFL